MKTTEVAYHWSLRRQLRKSEEYQRTVVVGAENRYSATILR